MNKENIYGLDLFLNGKVVVNCETQTEAEEFFQILRLHGVKWANGDYLAYTMHETYKDQTCYMCENNGLWYSNKDFFISVMNGERKVTVIGIPNKTMSYKELLNTWRNL